MSLEKVRVLKGLGAEIIRTRTSAAWDDEDQGLKRVKILHKYCYLKIMKLFHKRNIIQHLSLNLPLSKGSKYAK